MSISFKNYRALSTDPQNDMFAEIVRNLANLQTVFNQSQAPGVAERRLIGYPTWDTLVFAACGFDFGYVKPIRHRFYTLREPDWDKCKLMLDFDYRSNQLYDKSCFGNHGLLEGNPKLVLLDNIAKPTYSLLFDGVDDRVTIPHNAAFDTLNQYTWSFWIYPTGWGTSTFNTILNKGWIANGGMTMYIHNTAHTITHVHQNNSGVQSAVSTNLETLGGLNRWYHVVVTYDGANVRLYVNKVLKQTTAGTGQLVRGSVSVVLGEATQDFMGYMWEAGFWTDALAQTDIDDLYEGKIPLGGLVSLWRFEEGSGTTARDTVNYNSGTITGATYSTAQRPAGMPVTQTFDDGWKGSKVGYRFDGANDDVRVPEITEDTRITGKTVGMAFYFEIKTLDFSIAVDNKRQRLFEKFDDITKTYAYSVQLGTDGYLYFFVSWNGAMKRIRTAAPLLPNYFYRCWAWMDIAQSGNADVTAFLKFAIDGYQVSAPLTTDSEQWPASDDITDLDLVICASPLNGTLGGYYRSEMYRFRIYEEVPTAANILGLYTNCETTYQNPWSHNLILNQSIIQESSPKVREFEETVTVPTDALGADVWFYQIITNIKTRRFTETVPIPTLPDTWRGKRIFIYSTRSLRVTGTNNQHVDTKDLTGLSTKFSITGWVKYLGSTDGWGGVISRVNGLQDGNRLMLNGTKIRWHGQFKDSGEKWNDYRVTVPSYVGVWSHFAVTYDGAFFKIYFNGVLVYSTKRTGKIVKGSSKGFIGKGAGDEYFLNGYVDELRIHTDCLTPEQVLAYAQKDDRNTNILAYWRFENNALDSSDNAKYHGELMHGASYSTDVP